MTLAVTLKPSTDGKSAMLSWTPPQGAKGYVATIDGQEHSTDGVRHFSLDGSLSSMKIGLAQDGKPHAYGVDVLGILASGSATYPAVAPPPPPPSGWTVKSIFLRGSASYSAQWDAVKASGIGVTSGLVPADAYDVAHEGVHTWISIPGSYSDSDAVKWASDALSVKGPDGKPLADVAYVWDEPNSGQETNVHARSQAIRALGLKTAISHYDPSELKRLIAADAADIYGLDNYPGRTGWDMGVMKQLIAICDAAHVPYFVVLDAFEDLPNYLLPTGAQLQAEIDLVRASSALGVIVYSWDEPGGGTKLRDAPDLMAVLKGL